ncbi:MAG: DUF2177 family protein [Clostridiales bacterium]|nr:DUF2177 family protein [Clostridiales bacterium]
MIKWIVIFLVTFIIFMIIDFLWLSIFAKKFYHKHLGYIMAKKQNMLATVIFYVVFIIGLVFFVINPAINKHSVVYAIFVGSFYGVVTYGTYNLTNFATIKNWPISITIIDLIWGGFLCGLISLTSYLLFINYL